MRRAFTLIELLVVISIIALLIAILLPVLSSVRYESTNFLCVNRQRQFVQAGTAYCTDNKELFPDRGIDRPGGDPMWARWAMRMSQDESRYERFDDVMGSYMATETAVWCCPLYDGQHGSGGALGCLTHGKGHSTHRYTTYSFHGGLKEVTSAGHVYNPGDRRKLGDPYIIELADGRTYESGLLMSDAAGGDNGWVPVYYPSAPAGVISNRAPWSAITLMHQPPTSSTSQRTSRDEFRVMAVKDKTYTNWAYDDGSAETRTVSPNPGLLTSDEWTPVRADGNRYMLFPNQ